MRSFVSGKRVSRQVFRHDLSALWPQTPKTRFNAPPSVLWQFVRKYVYYPLANSQGAILEKLDEKNPVVYTGGGRRYKLFQFLSDEIGLPAFRQHLWQTVGILQISSSKEAFARNFYRAFPEATPFGHQWDMLGDIENNA